MKLKKLVNLLIVAVFAAEKNACAADSLTPIAALDLVFDEVDDIVAVEAEHFYRQTLSEKRAWHVTSSKNSPDQPRPGGGGAAPGNYAGLRTGNRGSPTSGTERTG